MSLLNKHLSPPESEQNYTSAFYVSSIYNFNSDYFKLYAVVRELSTQFKHLLWHDFDFDFNMYSRLELPFVLQKLA